MDQTKNLKLNLPQKNDLADINVINDNMEKIDNKIKLLEENKKDNKIIKDDSNNKNYKIGIENGLLYYMEVE